MSKSIKSYNLSKNVIKVIHDRAGEDLRSDSDWLDVFLTKQFKTEAKVKNPVTKKVIDHDLEFGYLMMSDPEIVELLRIRKKNKGGTITQRVIKGLAKEFCAARKSGLDNDQILTEWEVRGWKSFKAEWVTQGAINGQSREKTFETGSDRYAEQSRRLQERERNALGHDKDTTFIQTDG